MACANVNATFLNRGRARFANVIAADRNRVPVRQLAFAEREDIGDEPQRMPWRVDIGAARDIFLQDVVLDRAGQFLQRHALPLRDRHVQREEDDRRRIDGHRGRDLAERNAVEESAHVLDRIDGDADAPHLAGGQEMVRVVAHLRRQIEGHAQAADACASRYRYRRLDSCAVANPAYCRIVHSRPRYMVGWMPRVKGNSPGSESS
jgi:hypothetical protein